jgi:transcription antitermination factor NusB
MSEPSRQEPAEIVYCDTLPPHDQRAVIFHLLYAVEAFEYEISLSTIVDQFCRGFFCEVDRQGSIFRQASLIIEERATLDEEIRPLLHNWRFERISVAARLILRMSLWELRNTELDAPVIIDEAVELAKSFAEVDAYKFINGLLDEWVRRHASQPIVDA